MLLIGGNEKDIRRLLTHCELQTQITTKDGKLHLQSVRWMVVTALPVCLRCLRASSIRSRSRHRIGDNRNTVAVIEAIYQNINNGGQTMFETAHTSDLAFLTFCVFRELLKTEPCEGNSFPATQCRFPVAPFRVFGRFSFFPEKKTTIRFAVELDRTWEDGMPAPLDSTRRSILYLQQQLQ